MPSRMVNSCKILNEPHRCNLEPVETFTRGEIHLAAALGFAFGIFVAGMFVRLMS